MALSKENVIKLARDFVRGEHSGSKWKVFLEKPLSIEKCQGGFGSDVLGMGHHHWSVMFGIETPEGTAVMNPDHVIVMVDDETGRTVWFPVM
jgi:hypothetical protein